MQSTQNHLGAILWVLLSTFIWTVIFAAVKFADGEIDVFQLTLFRYLGALLTLGFLLPFQGRGLRLRSTQPWVHFMRALCGCGAAVAISWASANMPLVDATAIGMLSGVLAVLLGTFVLNEAIGGRHKVAIAVSVAGALIVMISKGAFQQGLSVLPSAIAFLSALLFAVEGLLITLLGRTERAYTVMFYVTLFGACLMLPPSIVRWQSIDFTHFSLTLLLGPLGILGQYCTIRGYRSAPLSVVAPVDYSWLVFSALLGLAIFHEVPGLGTWIGCAAILGGGWLLTRANDHQ